MPERITTASRLNFSDSSFLPLLAQVRRAKHADSLDLAAVEQFPGDQQGFDGLADAHVVGDENAYRVQPKRHEHRYELVNAGPDGYAAERAERRGPFAERQARGLPEQMGAGGIGEIVGGRQRKCRRTQPFLGQFKMGAG